MSILVEYVDKVLTPTAKQKSFMKSNVKSIKNVLTQCSSITPKEVHLAGSMEKGTMLSYHLDADIVFVYNKSQEVGNDWPKLVTKIYKTLKPNFPEIEVQEAGNIAVHIKTMLDKVPVNFDIVPSYYVNSPRMMADHTNSKLYTGVTAIWHSCYLAGYKNYPYFTHVVRLLKDWKKEQDVPFFKSLYLELIVADVYNNIIDEIDNPGSLDEVLQYCFENIIDTLDGYPVIPGNWKYCKDEDYEEQYSSPVLIDPANPSDNLLRNITKAELKKIRKKVEITMENLQVGYYADIFNRKMLTNFFDEDD